MFQYMISRNSDKRLIVPTLRGISFLYLNISEIAVCPVIHSNLDLLEVQYCCYNKMPEPGHLHKCQFVAENPEAEKSEIRKPVNLV